MNATDPQAAGRIQAALATPTTRVAAPGLIPSDTLKSLRERLKALCQEIAMEVVEAEAAERGAPADDPAQQAVTTMVTIAEAMSVEVVNLQRWLWDEAARRGVGTTAVANARGVSRQAQLKRAQRRLS